MKHGLTFIFVLVFSISIFAAPRELDHSSVEAFTSDVHLFMKGKVRTWIDNNGNYIVLPTGEIVKNNIRFPTYERAFIGNANQYYQISKNVDCESNTNTNYDFDDKELTGCGDSAFQIDLDTNKVEITCGEQEISFTEVPDFVVALNAVFVPSPRQRSTEYFAKTENEEYVFVDKDRYGGYDTFRLFAGTPGNMQLKTIANVKSYLDGGTTYIYTSDDEVLYIPTTLGRQQASPAWNGQNISLFDRKNADTSFLKISEVSTAKLSIEHKNVCDILLK